MSIFGLYLTASDVYKRQIFDNTYIMAGSGNNFLNH